MDEIDNKKTTNRHPETFLGILNDDNNGDYNGTYSDSSEDSESQ